MKCCFLFIFSAIVLASCGTSKKAVGTTPIKTVSANDFPYIESFHEGVRLNLREDLDGAKKAFEKCLSIRQNDDAVYFGLSQVAMKQNDFPKAISYIQKAQEIDKENIWYTEELAILLYDNKQFDKAIPYFKKLVEYEPKNLEWLYGYGECLLRNGKTEESIKVMDQAENVVGVHPDLIAEKYRLLMSIKKEDQAIKEVERGLKEHPMDVRLTALLVDHYFKKGNNQKGFEYLKKLSDADPDNGRVHIALGEYYTKTNDREKAFEHFTKGFKGEDVDIDTKMSVVLFIQESILKKDSRVDSLLNILIEVHPNEAKSYSLKGDEMMKNNKLKEAITYYRQALLYEKNIFPIWNQVMMLQYQENQFDELYEVSTECLTYFASNPIVYLLNGIAAIKTKKMDEAIETLNSGKQYLTKDKTLEAEFEAQLGEAYFAKKDFVNGNKHYKNGLKIEPSNNLIRNNYAFALANNNIQLNEALELANEVLKTNKDIPHFFHTRGVIYFALKNYSNALNDFEKALLLSNPNEKDISEIIEQIGDTNYFLGDKDKALEFWKTAQSEGRKSELLDKKINTKTYYANPL